MIDAGGVQRSDDVIRWFFAEQRRISTGRRLERLERAEADLRLCLERFAGELLTRQELALLALERQFAPEGAVARIAGVDAVLLLLPIYLDEPRYHGEDLEDRKLRIRLADAMAREVLRVPALREPAIARAAWIVDAAVQHATWLYRQEREASRGW
jgi:hypothetical protein